MKVPSPFGNFSRTVSRTAWTDGFFETSGSVVASAAVAGGVPKMSSRPSSGGFGVVFDPLSPVSASRSSSRSGPAPPALFISSRRSSLPPPSSSSPSSRQRLRLRVRKRVSIYSPFFIGAGQREPRRGSLVRWAHRPAAGQTAGVRLAPFAAARAPPYGASGASALRPAPASGRSSTTDS